MGDIRVLVITGLALAIAVLGCGGGSSSLTKAEYVKEANAVCQKWVQEREEAFATSIQKYEGQKPTPKNQEAAAIEVVLHPYERMTQGLADLGFPSTDKSEAEAVLEAMEAAEAKVKANPRIVVTGSPFTKADKLAGIYGLDKCQT